MKKNESENEHITKSDLSYFGQNLRKEINDDFKTHVGFLYEKFSSDVKLIAESQQMTNQKLDNIINNQNNLTQRVNRAEVRLDVVEAQR